MSETNLEKDLDKVVGIISYLVMSFSRYNSETDEFDNATEACLADAFEFLEKAGVFKITFQKKGGVYMKGRFIEREKGSQIVTLNTLDNKN